MGRTSALSSQTTKSLAIIFKKNQASIAYLSVESSMTKINHSALTQSASDASAPPRSATGSLESIRKRKLGRLTDTSTSTLDHRHVKKPKLDELSEPYIIAYSELIQGRTDLAYGVLFEIARLISGGVLDYDQISAERLSKLAGNNAHSAPKTREILKETTVSAMRTDPAFAQENAATSSWQQLDMEEEALLNDPYAGLGHSETYPGWYGGKVGFRGKLDGDKGLYKISLERCTLGPSCRLMRRFGSKNFLRIKIQDKILHRLNNDLDKFFLRPFVLWGNVFRSFYAKEGTVFLFRTNEMLVDGKILSAQCSGLSLLELIDWHNSLMANSQQSMTKWSTRMALCLSNSIPGPILDAENILRQDDKISKEGSDMTDGCGDTTRSTTMAVFRTLNPESWPTAFQFRLGGAKGMATEKSETSTTEPLTVWLRDSQVKISYPVGHHDPRDPSVRIIDLLRTSYMRAPGRISAETIINLAENGVSHSIFTHLLKTNLAEVVKGLTMWDGPDAMFNLWVNVEKAGAVVFSRRAREAGGEARAKGYGESYDDEDDEDDEDGMKFDIAAKESTAWWADQTSGCPSQLEETCLVLIDAGFKPCSLPVLRDKLKCVVTTRIKNVAVKYRYELPLSVVAFVVPDPYGFLGEDEIHVKCSRRILQTHDGLLTDIVLGQVLLTRNPCKLPTDTRKLRAVEHPSLRSYTDLIVCSVQGKRRLLDFLAGGDYDGDTATVIWDPDIVKQFNNADEKYSEEPKGLGGCFTEEHNETVADFISKTTSFSLKERTLEVQKYLLGALRDTSVIGKYSGMHDTAIYSLGYAHPGTVKLAYKFCKVLDAPKTGLKIKNGTYMVDMATYGATRGPMWKDKKPSKVKSEWHYVKNEPYTKRGPDSEFISGPFVMDVLDNQARKEKDRMLQILEEIFKPLEDMTDQDLIRPWMDAVESAKQGSPDLVRAKQKDLLTIAQHVETMYEVHRKDVKHSFTTWAIERRQDTLRGHSQRFATFPTLKDMEVIMDAGSISRLRASYAYVYDLEQRRSFQQKWSRFPWDVALRDLCEIKAHSLGPSKTVTNSFYERFRLSRR
ncbi:hypothetical protein DXG03_008661 [Asterophora parasitica]|uniref:RNA-dependent RNA polymerase n=1 Tax=Asterophora parasitica TaxID=117018 RepID=A0A9P7G5Q8_9AGAR|nr:hypothetical protein DXG03_008661 [Asterophora parasitica]